MIGIQPGSAPGREAARRLAESDVILASRRILDDLTGGSASPGDGGGQWSRFLPKVKAIDKVEDTVTFLRGFAGKAAVLASGDPLFFGIGRVLAGEFPREELDVHPALSSMQLAFARIGRPWEEAFFVSLHGEKMKKRRFEPADLPLLAGIHRRLMILTGGEGRRPGDIAPFLPQGCRVFVFERIGYPDENISETTPEGILARQGAFLEPNLMIVETDEEKIDPETGRPAGPPARTAPAEDVCFGLGEEEFEHDALITKDEVRAALIHKLRLPREGVLWDIGAGSGSVGIEAKRLSPGLKVYAVEKDHLRAQRINLNILRLRAGAIRVVEGEAPGALAGLPVPQRVVIGGGGGRLGDIIKAVSHAMEKGIVAVSAITIESFTAAIEALRREGFGAIEAATISVSRMTPVADRNYMKALNSVYIIRAARQ